MRINMNTLRKTKGQNGITNHIMNRWQFGLKKKLFKKLQGKINSRLGIANSLTRGSTKGI